MSENNKLEKFDKLSTSELKKIGVQALPNRPNASSAYGNAGLSPKELKEWFDKIALRLANHINSVTDKFSTDEIAKYIRISLDQHNVSTLQDLIEAVLDGSFAEKLLMVLPAQTETERASLQDTIFAINRKTSEGIDRVEKLITDLGYGYTDADVVFIEDGGEVGADVEAVDDNGARRLIFTFRNFGKGAAEAALDFPLKEGSGNNSLMQKTDSDVENKAITENSIALGEGTIAGAKGYYFTEIFYGNASTNPQIRISSVQPTEAGLYISSEALSPNKLFNAPDYEAGDVFNLICNDHFALFGTIVSITNDIITFTGNVSLFKTGLSLQVSYGHSKMENGYYINLVPDYDDYTLMVPTKPLNGIVEVCKTAFASGYDVISAGEFGDASGKRTKVVEAYGHTEGVDTIAGYAAHGEGDGCEAPAKYSHAQNKDTKTNAYAGTSMGIETVVEEGADGGVATGHKTHARKKYTFTGGDGTEANAEDAVAFGKQTIASALAAFAEGLGFGGAFGNEWGPSEASGVGSHVEGIATKAMHEGSHAENFGTEARAKASHAGGLGSIASGYAAFIHAMFGLASGDYSAAFNYYTIASGFAQFVTGMYNKENPDALFIVGNGTSDTDRSNAFEVLKDGSFILGKPFIVTGTYIGTGKAGTYDRNTLTFDFKPHFLMVKLQASGTRFGLYTENDTSFATYDASGYYNNNVELIENDNGTWTVEWYAPVTTRDVYVGEQMNGSGTYCYFAV